MLTGVPLGSAPSQSRKVRGARRAEPRSWRKWVQFSFRSQSEQSWLSVQSSCSAVGDDQRHWCLITTLGKKNWLFMGEAAAGNRSAIIYTVIESCRRRGAEPFAYLKDVLTRLPQMTNKQVPELLPAV